ncbi:hypothetical protein ABW19_dt0209975 [Dactylella cylindrospora]|nr:hypothetical protein ABW19_dt0209975 [Dactylella cylindrospora]
MLAKLLRAPANPGMKVLDRAAFTKRIPTVCATVVDRRDTQKARKAAAPVMLLDPIGRTDIDDKSLYKIYDNKMRIPLSPHVKPDDESTMPTHLNLHDEYVEYKDVIAQVILDKNKNVKTVVRKLEDVGATSEFRTFPMEIVAGEPNTKVRAKHSDCYFEFDFEKVYWNSRLENEHSRVAMLSNPGEAVCDVMAGVGPFAIPAAKKRRALVWANDLNKDSYLGLLSAIRINKVDNLVQPFNLDGREFIRESARALLRDAGKTIEYNPNRSRGYRDQKKAEHMKGIEKYTIPKVFTRYVMNLPASAVEFLDAFIGLYAGMESIFEDPSKPFSEETKYKLPIIHCYTFNRHRENEIEIAAEEICGVVSRYLQYPVTVSSTEDLREQFQKGMLQPIVGGHKGGDDAEIKRPQEVFVEGGLNIGYLRAVAPNKRMYCITFRLPREVAFRPPQEKLTEEEKALEKKKIIWLRSDENQEWPGSVKTE